MFSEKRSRNVIGLETLINKLIALALNRLYQVLGAYDETIRASVAEFT